MADSAQVADTSQTAYDESYFIASQWQLMWRKFRKHKLAILGGVVLAVMYIMALFCELIAPYGVDTGSADTLFIPPMRVRFYDGRKITLQPFVYGVKDAQDPVTWRRMYKVDKTVRYPVRLFVRGDRYKLWGLFLADLHLFGVDKPGVFFLLGSDHLGRDLFSRILYASRISLSIGLVGVTISFVLGVLLGGLSGYYGGSVDMVIQRVIEFLMSMPRIPLWMALSAALPADWPPIRVYFGITLILSIFGWTTLARTVRGKFLELRGEDFALAAKIAGASDWHIILRHLAPSFMSYIIVRLTLAIPQMILWETALSFLGVGLRPPAVSWGVLLQQAQNMRTVAMNSWLFFPALFVVITVLSFNFMGDGLRDAADPYK